MIYYKICPYCQEVCGQIEHDDIGLMGCCTSYNHPVDFSYCFTTSSNSVNIDLHFEDYHLTVQFNPDIKHPILSCRAVKKSCKKIMLFKNAVFLNWQDFDCLKLSDRLDKIFNMQSFA